jgi:hypothetical protein
LEGAEGEGVVKGADFGVVGEDCEAMAVISESFEVRKAEGFVRKMKGEPFVLKRRSSFPFSRRCEGDPG